MNGVLTQHQSLAYHLANLIVSTSTLSGPETISLGNNNKDTKKVDITGYRRCSVEHGTCALMALG